MKKISVVTSAVFISLLCSPFTLLAQTKNDVTNGVKGFSALIETVTSTVVKSTASLLLALALLAFFWGIVEYIWAKRQGDGKGVSDGTKFMSAGLIALFVMFSVYGIINFAQGTLFGSADMTTIKIPNINFGKSGSSGTGIGTGGGTGINTGGAGIDNGGGNTQATYSVCISNGNSAAQCAAQAAASSGNVTDPSDSGTYTCDPQDPSCDSNGSNGSDGGLNNAKGDCVKKGNPCKVDKYDGICDTNANGLFCSVND